MTSNIVDISSKQHKSHRERVILKALLAWAKSRFAIPLKVIYPPETIEIVSYLESTFMLERVAWINDDDALLIQKNSILFRKVAMDFMKELLPDNIFLHYGSVNFDVNKATSVVSVSLMPTELLINSEVRPLIPCMMTIFSRKDVVDKYKEKESYVGDNHVDVLPLLKMHVDKMLTSEELTRIDKLFSEYQNNEDCVSAREEQECKIQEEKINLRKVVNALMNSGEGMQQCKAAISIYNIVENAYRVKSFHIKKIKFKRTGAYPVKEFLMGFQIKSENVDVVSLSVVLQNLVQFHIERDIKVMVGPNYDSIIFHTCRTSKVDTSMIDCVWASDAEIDYVFDNHVAPRISLDTCYAIIEEVVNLSHEDSLNI